MTSNSKVESIIPEEVPAEDATTQDPLDNLFDPARYAVDASTDVGQLGVEKVLLGISVRKPNKQEFFQAHAKLRLSAPIIEVREARETYLLDPGVAAQLPGDHAVKLLVLCVNRQSVPFLWPVPTPSTDGPKNSWNDSAMDVLKVATGNWVRMAANMSAGRYDLYKAPGITAAPLWPREQMPDILKLAFGASNIVADVDHPLIRQLTGQE